MVLIRRAAAVLLVSLLTACSITPYNQEGREASNRKIDQQIKIATARINNASQQPVNLIYTGYALFDAVSAFKGDIMAGAEIANRISAANVQLLFSNVLAYTEKDPKLPFATEFDVERGLAETARLAEQVKARGAKSPLVIVLFTSHGSKHNLALRAGDLSVKLLDGVALANVLKPLEGFPTVVILSACHSGSLIPALKNDNRIILTATSPNRVSFGCNPGSRRTWYVDSLAKAFDENLTLKEWHESTAKIVAAEETEMKYEASEPRIYVGRNMTEYASTQMARLTNVSLRKTKLVVKASNSHGERQPTP